jgi:hypothetical protein
MATASMVCGIVGLLLFFLLVLPVVAVVLGAVALAKAKQAPGPGNGLGRAWAGLVLGIVGLLLFVGIVIGGAIAGWYDDDVVSSFDLEVGQCIELDVTATEVAGVPVVPCDRTHQGEVFLVSDIPSSRFPGDESLSRRTEDLCTGDAFEDYVGASYMRSRFEWYGIIPTEDSWRLGDRDVVCLVVRADGGNLRDSVRGSGS